MLTFSLKNVSESKYSAIDCVAYRICVSSRPC